MFGWRRKRDGFEWRSYVKTTILVKRKKRREKLDEAKRAALDKLHEAGRAGQAAGEAGLEAAKQRVAQAGREAGVAGAAAKERIAKGARVAGERFGIGARAAAQAALSGGRVAGSGMYRVSRMAGGKLKRVSSAGLDAVADGLGDVGRAMSPRISLPLLIAGLAALLGAAARIAYDRFDTVAISAGVIAAALIALAVLPVIAGRATLADPFSTRRVKDGEVARPDESTDGGLIWAQRGLALTVLGGSVVIAGWIILQVAQWSPGLPTSIPAVTSQPTLIEGKAKSLTGDSMLVNGKHIVLSGIEAPELRQRCRRANGRRWNCGRSALNALRRVTGSHNVSCSVADTDGAGRYIATCRIGEKDIAAEMVRNGHVFASGGFFSSYSGEEDEAEERKLGIWTGDAQRPAEFRAERWETAKADAPEGCPIKGKDRLRSRNKVYILPWSARYDSYQVAERRGDRWFCSEEEAQAAGWERLDS